MKKSVETSCQIINQEKLSELLKLPLSVIRFLREQKIIKSERVGINYIFDEKSVEQFRESFDVKDYLTVGECRKKLRKYDFYSEYLYKNFFYSELRIYVTVKKLIKGGCEIPDEYRLDVKQFGTTKYISRKSFAKTLNWFRNLYRKIYPIFTKQQSEELGRRCEEFTKERNEYMKKFNKGSIKFMAERLRKGHRFF